MFVRTEGVTWQGRIYWLETAVILLLVILYFYGRHKQTKSSKLSVFLFIWGMSLLFVAIASPLTHLTTQLFSMRVLQRILIVAVIPVLLMGSDPVPDLFAGLPLSMQAWLQQLPATKPKGYDAIKKMTRPAAIWLTFICLFWIGYDPAFHHITMKSHTLHSVEAMVLIVIACLYWWHILAVSPQLHAPMPAVVRIGYVLAGALPIKIIGLVLLFTNSKIYSYPGSLQIGYLSITDQSLGAMFHWSLGGLVFTWTGMYLMRAWFSIEAEKPILPHASWSTKEVMLAPGFDSQPQQLHSHTLPKKIESNQLPIKADEEKQECPNTRKSSKFIAVPVKIFLTIKSLVVTSHEN